MKKIFKLSHPKTKRPRLIEAAKHDVRKYLKRERNKVLPEGADFWDFDCKAGTTSEDAQEIHWSKIPDFIDKTDEKQLDSFYVQIVAKAASRIKN